MSQNKHYLKFKLDAVNFSENISLTKAADNFKVNVSQIKRRKKQKIDFEENPKNQAKVAKTVRTHLWRLI